MIEDTKRIVDIYGFSPDTFIWTEDGLCEIQYITPGIDKILTRCPGTGEMAYKKVLRVYESQNDVALINVSLMPLSSHHGSAVQASYFHRFWVEDQGWTATGELKLGDKLILRNGELAEMLSLKPWGDGPVYTLEVEGFDTYFVGYDGVWVNNKTIKTQIINFPIEDRCTHQKA